MFTVLICGKIRTEKLADISYKIAISAQSSGYYPIKLTEPLNNNEALDSEVYPGASQFYNTMDCNYMLCLNCLPKSNKQVKHSCSGISEDLSDYFFKAKRSSDFLSFMKKLESDLLIDVTEDLYLIFADEWDENQEIRLIQNSFKGVHDYFSTNYSWQQPLYNITQKRYVLRHYYIPLVFRLNPK